MDRGAAELVADRLFALGATAVAEHAGADEARITLVADLDPSAVEVLLAEGWSPRVRAAAAGWEDSWREHARVWRCGRHLVLRPAWVDPVPLEPGDVEIVMEPGRAFGSGSHPTTRLCLAEVERLVRPGDRVLDVGCGTGVLGVAAALLGAGRVDAVDIDPHAVEVTRALAERHGVADRVAASTTPLAELDRGDDLVLANLLLPALRELADDLVARTDGGHLVVSGVLVEQVAEAVELLRGVDVVARAELDGWAVVVLRRPGGGAARRGSSAEPPG